MLIQSLLLVNAFGNDPIPAFPLRLSYIRYYFSSLYRTWRLKKAAMLISPESHLLTEAPMQFCRMYSGADGKSHFEELDQDAASKLFSNSLPVKALVFKNDMNR